MFDINENKKFLFLSKKSLKVRKTKHSGNLSIL